MKNKLLLIGLLALVILSSSAMALTAPSGGVSYYNFSDTTDLWGSNDATNNGATSVTDYPTYNISGDSSPNSYDFDGSNDIYLSSNPLANVGTGDFAVSIWVKPDSFSDYNTFVSLGGNPSGAEDRILLTFNNNGKIETFIDDDTTSISTKSTSSYSTGTWYHIVSIRDSASQKLYVDGIIDSSYTHSNTADLDTTYFNNNAYIGSHENVHYFDGQIDQVKIYNRSLNETEVENLYNYGSIEGATIPDNFSVSVTDSWNGDNINNISVTIENGSYDCYQESATTEFSSVDGSCELNYSGSYEDYNGAYTGNAVDGDWTTKSSDYSSYLNETYVVPANATSANFEVKYYNTANSTDYYYNLTLSSDFLSDELLIRNKPISGLSIADPYVIAVYNYSSSSWVEHTVEPNIDFNTELEIYETRVKWIVEDDNSYTYTNTSGNTVTTELLANGWLYDISVYSPNYFTSNYESYNSSNNPLEATLNQSEVMFQSKEYITNDNLANCNHTIEGITQEQGTTWGLTAGLYNVTSTCEDYFNKTQQINVSILQSNTISLTGVYNGIANITLEDQSGDPITNATYELELESTGSSISTGSINETTNIPLLKNRNYTITIESEGYVSENRTFYANETYYNETITLYEPGSLYLYFYELGDGLIDSQQVNYTIKSSSRTYEGDTSSGTAVEDVINGEYVLTINSESYRTSKYYFVIDSSYQNISAYLLKESETTPIFFTVIDNYDDEVQGAKVDVQYNINGTSVSIGQRITDLSGQVRFYLDQEEDYYVSVSKEGYETFTGDLTPTTTTYTLRIKELGAQIIEPINSDVYYQTNYYYNNGSSINFTYYINSNQGLLTGYGFSTEYDGVNSQSYGGNPSGGLLTINISDYDIATQQTFTVDYWFVSGGENHTWSEEYFIFSDQSYSRDFELSNTGRIIIAFLTVIIFTIIGSRLASVSGGIIAGLLSYGFLFLFNILDFNFMNSLAGSGIMALTIVILLITLFNRDRRDI